MLPLRDDDDVLTRSAKKCESCGYLHPIQDGPGLDLCERCKARLPGAMIDLLRLQNVETKRRDRINCDEEERLRLGYDIHTAVRFADQNGSPLRTVATVLDAGEEVFKLTYGRSATLWRINLGWRQRKKENPGFWLDTERGYWENTPVEPDEDEPTKDDFSARKKRVIPFVEDRRNCLLVEPVGPLDPAVLLSLQAALKSAIQVTCQLEDNELAAELLPSRDDPRLLLLYESAEGGAGVLRRLLEDQDLLQEVGRMALEICHFAPDSPPTQCEAACYDCLLNYANQPSHRHLDRHSIEKILRRLSLSSVEIAASEDRFEDIATPLRIGTGANLAPALGEVRAHAAGPRPVPRRILRNAAGLLLFRIPNRGVHRRPAARLAGPPSPRRGAERSHGRRRLRRPPLPS